MASDNISSTVIDVLVDEPIPDNISIVHLLVMVKDSRYVLVNSPSVIQPGQQAIVRIIGTNAEVGNKAGVLTIYSNASNAPLFKINLSGNVIRS